MTDELVRAEHLRAVHGHASTTLAANVIAASAVTGALWDGVSAVSLLLWLFCMLGLSAVRFVMAVRFLHSPGHLQQNAAWERLFVQSVFASGLLWGAASVLFYPAYDSLQGMTLVVLVVGLAAASTASLSYHRYAYPLFVLLSIGPLVAKIWTLGDAAHGILGVALPLLFVLLIALSGQIYRFSHFTITTLIRNQRRAFLDHLTGVANRRAFDEVLQREWYRSLRNGQPLGLILIDIDDFKHCNDRYGHAVGDQVLRVVAGELEKRARRSSDRVARVGGEEFSIILPETDAQSAMAVAQLIHDEIRKENAALSAKYGLVWPTLSFGVSACIPVNSADYTCLMRQADGALYSAKSSGKDRVVGQCGNRYCD